MWGTQKSRWLTWISLQLNASPNWTEDKAPGIVILLRFLMSSIVCPYSILLFWNTFLFIISTAHWATLSSHKTEFFSSPNLRRERCLILLWDRKSIIGPYVPEATMHNSLKVHFMSSVLALATGTGWATQTKPRRTSQRLWPDWLGELESHHLSLPSIHWHVEPLVSLCLCLFMYMDNFQAERQSCSFINHYGIM